MLRIFLTFVCLAAVSPASAAEKPAESEETLSSDPQRHVHRPRNGIRRLSVLQRLNQHGFQIDVHFLNEQPPRPITWDLIKRYNCL